MQCGRILRLRQLLYLALSKLASPRKIHAKQSDDGVNNLEQKEAKINNLNSDVLRNG